MRGAGLLLFLWLSAAGATTCDVYELGGTPCVAAHSTVRALFGGYRGALFLVRRASDNATTPINATTSIKSLKEKPFSVFAPVPGAGARGYDST